MVKQKTILLVDSNALIHRAYHALPSSMRSPSGQITNAVFGFFLSLLSSVEEFRPEYVLCCFDVVGETFRKKIYSPYKAQRKEMDVDLVNQFPLIYSVLESAGLPKLSKVGFEADDLIGTLARRFEKDHKILILSGDKDVLQLVDDNISVVVPKQGIRSPLIFTPQLVEKEYGVNPPEFVNYKALRGDPSDNIPGVRGIGEKTAGMLIKTFHSLDNLYDAVCDEERISESPVLTKRIVTALLDDEAAARMSLFLSQIKTDVPIEIDLSAAKIGQGDSSVLTKILTELGFASVSKRMENTFCLKDGTRPEVIGASLPNKKMNIDSIVSEILSLDSGRIVFISTVLAVGQADELTFSVSLPDEIVICSTKNKEAINLFKKIVTKGNCFLCFAEVKSWLKLLTINEREELAIDWHRLFDAGIIERLLQKRSIITSVSNEFQLHEQVKRLNETFSIYFKELDNDLTKSVWEDIERPLIMPIANMEDRGLLVDTEKLVEISSSISQEAGKIEQEIWRLAGETLNLSSPQQLSAVLFEKMKLPTKGIRKNTNGYSTDARALEGLVDEHQIINLILRFRELTKLKSTYLDVFPVLIGNDGRLRGSFNQVGALTGRISSSEPNLQNIPIRSEPGGIIRSAFIASPGFQLLSLDYSQIELRILAHLAEDEKMTEIFMTGRDVHAITASALFNVGVDRVSDQMRRTAKMVNFGLLYGLSAHGLASRLNIGYSEAEQFIGRYFMVFPKIERYLNGLVEQARRQGCLYTIFGRRRLFPDIMSENWNVRKASERTAMNFPMQGSQADIIKKAIVVVENKYATNPSEARLLLSVHDELLLEVADDHLIKVAVEVARIMVSVCQLKVPLVVNARHGTNWRDLTEIRTD